MAAVLGGLDSPPGAVIGGLLLGLALSYVSGYAGSALAPLAAFVILSLVLMVGPPGCSRRRRSGRCDHSTAPRRSAAAPRRPVRHGAPVLERSTLLRALLLVVLGAVVLAIVSDVIGDYNNLQLAYGAYYFAALAGLTVLAGSSGQISLGHGALMAVGAYTVALLIGNEGWSLTPRAGRAVTVISGAGRGPARRRRQPAARARTWRARRSRSRSACRRWRTSSPRRSAARTG